MLVDMLEDLLNARDQKGKEKAYKRLEKVGVDRVSAKIMAAELRKENVDE